MPRDGEWQKHRGFFEKQANDPDESEETREAARDIGEDMDRDPE